MLLILLISAANRIIRIFSSFFSTVVERGILFYLMQPNFKIKTNNSLHLTVGLVFKPK